MGSFMNPARFDGRFAAASNLPAYEHGDAFADQSRPRASSILQYNSKPGAPAILYLDFRGQHSEAGQLDQAGELTAGRERLAAEFAETANDMLCDSDSIEVRVVREVFQAVAEKFAQFNVNITTVHPGDDSARNARRVAVSRLYEDCYRSILQYR